MAEASTVSAREAAHFGAMAAEWWDPTGSSAPLHRLNPPRLAYLRRQIDAHWGGDAKSFAPLAGKRALDMGCGAGLLAEPLARLGAAVTGVDASAEVIAAARAHAGALAIDYRVGGVEQVAGERFDLVTSLEVVEHVVDPGVFVHGLAGHLLGHDQQAGGSDLPGDRERGEGLAGLRGSQAMNARRVRRQPGSSREEY